MLELYINIKNERLKNGWNQTELAKRVGYSDKSMIAKIEAGKVDLPQTKIRAFANVFGVTESYLMGWDEEEKEIPEYNPAIQDFVEILPKLTKAQIDILLHTARLFVEQNIGQ